MADKNYRASTGVDEFYYALLDPTEVAIITGEPERVEFLQNISIEMPQEAVRAYGDNRTAEIAVASGNISVTGAFHTIPNEDKTKLFGLDVATGLTAYGSTDSPPYVAAIFSKTYEDGSREWVGLTKGMFMRPTITGATKADGVEFSSEEMTAEFMDRDVTGFDDAKSVIFGRDTPGTNTQRDALFTAVFGANHPDFVVGP